MADTSSRVDSGTVIVAYLHPGEVSHSFHASERDYRTFDLMHKQRLRGFISQECGASRVVDGRNDAVRQFLATPAEWLMWIDADMGFEPAAIDRLIGQASAKERPIVGGLAFGQKKGPGIAAGARLMIPVPTLYRWSESDEVAGFAPWHAYPRDQLVQVDATGGAFILVHRSVYETLADGRFPHPREWYDETLFKGQIFSEDLTFCRRATEAGFPIFVDTSVKTSHFKHHYLTEETVGDLTQVPNHVVIPYKNRADLTGPLVNSLLGQNVDHIWLLDNGSNTKTRNWAASIADRRVTVVDAEGWNIHQMWNEGLERAGSRPANVFVLNNDLEVGPGFVDGLARALRSDPLLSVVGPNYDGREGTSIQYVEDICAGRYDGTGGLSGFAFVLKGEAGYRFPEDLAWYGGDSHMVWTALRSGTRVGIARDVKCVHVGGGSQTGDWSDPDMLKVLEADQARLHEMVMATAG